LKLQKDNQKKKADASRAAEKMRKVEWHKVHPHEPAPKKINKRHIYCSFCGREWSPDVGSSSSWLRCNKLNCKCQFISCDAKTCREMLEQCKY
jgi:hypothetical protein